MIGEEVSVNEQSKDFVHLRDCVLSEKQGDQPAQVHVSLVHSGVQLCEVTGSGSVTLGQLFDS